MFKHFHVFSCFHGLHQVDWKSQCPHSAAVVNSTAPQTMCSMKWALLYGVGANCYSLWLLSTCYQGNRIFSVTVQKLNRIINICKHSIMIKRQLKVTTHNSMVHQVSLEMIHVSHLFLQLYSVFGGFLRSSESHTIDVYKNFLLGLLLACVSWAVSTLISFHSISKKIFFNN